MYYCKICNNNFERQTELANHYRWYHKKENTVCRCDKCQKEIKDKSGLSNHKKICGNVPRQETKPCEYCNKLQDGSYGSGRFCDEKCARGFASKAKRKEINEKMSKKLKGKNKGLESSYYKAHPDKGKNYIPRIDIFCKKCGKKIRFDSKLCRNCNPKDIENRKKISMANKGKCGGIRNGGGFGKMGWYRGYYCHSSWELAWVIYNLEHNITFKRNIMGFKYVFNQQESLYYPDFILEDNSYVEIKGYAKERDYAKFQYFPYKLKILHKEDLKDVFDYVKNKYGSDFIKMYENKK